MTLPSHGLMRSVFIETEIVLMICEVRVVLIIALPAA